MAGMRKVGFLGGAFLRHTGLHELPGESNVLRASSVGRRVNPRSLWKQGEREVEVQNGKS